MIDLFSTNESLFLKCYSNSPLIFKQLLQNVNDAIATSRAFLKVLGVKTHKTYIHHQMLAFYTKRSHSTSIKLSARQCLISGYILGFITDITDVCSVFILSLIYRRLSWMPRTFFASLNDMKSSKTGDKLSNQILYIVCSESRVSNWAFVY